MDAQQFCEFTQAAAEMIVNYTENLRNRPVLPSVTPGYLHSLVPEEVPKKGEDWREILKDMERVILPGITNWQSPRFHAYYPTSTSYPAIVGELLSSGLGIIGFSWITSPACTELEVVVMDWLGKMIGLPSKFLNCTDGPGGGVIQGSASEATFLCLLAAKERMLKKVQEEFPDLEESYIKGRMIAYTSDQANSSVEKAGLLGSMKMRLLESDEEGRLTGDIVRRAVEEDRKNGLIPTFVCATLGTTPTCAYDLIEEISTVCQPSGIWLHVDAAYAGSACVCPEFRYLLHGVESADSFNFNPHKWLLVNFDCSTLWVQDSSWLVNAFNVDRVYLQHQNQGSKHAPDYRHWQIPLGRRFRALKLWITLRCYGEEGMQAHIRKHVALAIRFEGLVRADPRFEVVTKTTMGLVCFRLKGSCEQNKSLLAKLMARKNVYLIAGKFRGRICLRFVVCSRFTEPEDISYTWKEVQKEADELLPKAEVMASVTIVSGNIHEKSKSVSVAFQQEESHARLH